MNNPRKPVVVVTRKLPASVEARMGELFSVELNHDDRPFSRERLAEAMARADVLVPTLTDTIDAQLIEKAGPNLKLIASFSNGIDNVDVDAAARKGITVTNTPNVLTEDTARDVLAGFVQASSHYAFLHALNSASDRSFVEDYEY